MTALAGTRSLRTRRARRVRAHRGCDVGAMSHPTPMTTHETPDPDTDARLTEHRLVPPLERNDEPGNETPRGTIGRSQLGVEARRTVSTLDGFSGKFHKPTPAEPLSSRELVSDQATLVAIGGSGTMSLNTFRRARQAPYAEPSASSMRFMETGLALVAIAVALLLNLGR